MSMDQPGSMQLPVPVRAPFDLAQSLTFMRRFTPCRHAVVVGEGRVTTALSIGGRAVGFSLAGAGADVTLELDDALAPTVVALVVERARQWLSADDDLGDFLVAAGGDHPRFRAVVAALHGLHHVRFLTLGEIAVQAVLMQRTPELQVARAKQRFAARFGPSLVVGGTTLHAFPSLDELVELDEADYREVLRLPGKARALPGVVRGVAALGEGFLRAAPYPEARAALLTIPGIGPFSAAAILLRGLGRMDDVPLEGAQFERPARAVYGATYDPAAIRRRYGAALGHWSFYLKTGAARLADGTLDAALAAAAA